MRKEHLKSLDKNGLDNTISPRQDFYNHVNKKWMESHPLSGVFPLRLIQHPQRLQRASCAQVVTGLAATNPAKGTDAYKIANLYELGMDSIRRNREEQHPSGRNSQKSKTPVPKR